MVRKIIIEKMQEDEKVRNLFRRAELSDETSPYLKSIGNLKIRREDGPECLTNCPVGKNYESN